MLDAFLRVAPEAGPAVPDLLKISPRALTRRRSEGRFTTPAESDRLDRLINLYAHAADVLGSVEATDEWMTSPAVALGEPTPSAYARNEAGAQRVAALLTRIDHGVFRRGLAGAERGDAGQFHVLLNTTHLGRMRVEVSEPEACLFDPRLAG